MTTRMMPQQRIVAIVVTCCALALSVQPASAAYSTTSVKPYDPGSTSKYCDFHNEAVVCEVLAASDHRNGKLALDVKAVATARVAGLGLGYGFIPVPYIYYPFVYGPGWFYASTWFWTTQDIPQPVDSISITVKGETGGVSASATGGAKSAMSLTATAYPPSTCGCQGWTSVLLASSDGQTSGTPATHTLTFTVKRADGGKIPAGRMGIRLGLNAWGGGGAGTATGNASATILSVSSFQK